MKKRIEELEKGLDRFRIKEDKGGKKKKQEKWR